MVMTDELQSYISYTKLKGTFQMFEDRAPSIYGITGEQSEPKLRHNNICEAYVGNLASF